MQRYKSIMPNFSFYKKWQIMLMKRFFFFFYFLFKITFSVGDTNWGLQLVLSNTTRIGDTNTNILV